MSLQRCDVRAESAYSPGHTPVSGAPGVSGQPAEASTLPHRCAPRPSAASQRTAAPRRAVGAATAVAPRRGRTPAWLFRRQPLPPSTCTEAPPGGLGVPGWKWCCCLQPHPLPGRRRPPIASPQCPTPDHHLLAAVAPAAETRRRGALSYRSGPLKCFLFGHSPSYSFRSAPLLLP